ncbi:hypothetical protein THII_1188 [Thioploca ingrica]|uniref:Uncharacterized protein n=1 Tax=Thioploca ingrica TaxID=40754 RepID=A0A090AKE0_9GAMM|nr:hypothetical protein THII_1188 [Thioploca ingrica]
MTTNNRNDFNQCVALVFNLLYQEFPKETNITIDEFIESADEDMTDNYFATIRFLQREKFIYYQLLNYNTFTGVTLTTKGLKILDTLSTLDEETTIAQEISTALQQNSKPLIGAIIQKIIKLSG